MPPGSPVPDQAGARGCPPLPARPRRMPLARGLFRFSIIPQPRSDKPWMGVGTRAGQRRWPRGRGCRGQAGRGAPEGRPAHDEAEISAGCAREAAKGGRRRPCARPERLQRHKPRPLDPSRSVARGLPTCRKASALCGGTCLGLGAIEPAVELQDGRTLLEAVTHLVPIGPDDRDQTICNGTKRQTLI